MTGWARPRGRMPVSLSTSSTSSPMSKAYVCAAVPAAVRLPASASAYAATSVRQFQRIRRMPAFSHISSASVGRKQRETSFQS